ncbi:MAG: hypothetical protein ACTHMV_12960, partial [Chitinophagaceae bacterium]
MTKKLLLLLLIASPYLAKSQARASDPPVPGINPFRDDQNMRAIYNKPHDLNAEGSPFLYDQYIPAEISVMQGGVYPGIKIKLNVVDNELLFMADNGQEMSTTTPVKSIKLNMPKEDGSGMEELIFEGNGIALNSPGARIYQVLVDGKARLLKHIQISYSDVRKYPEGIMARVFKKKSFYYAVVKNQPPVKFDKSKSEVMALFPDKQNEVASFIQTQKLKCKTEEDLVKVFQY